MARKENHKEKYSKVKMYKTHQGWVSCLTRFFSILHFSKKVEAKDTAVDPDELGDDRFSGTLNSYLKGLGVVSTILGVGGVIDAAAPTTVQAATETVDMSLQELGSTSVSETDSTSSQSTSNQSTSGSLSVDSTSASSQSYLHVAS
ncbi:serine-rich glycoprotein adhesin [Limosilactobacillus sp.]|jgi:hypothetical protein|uniref:serine-rich glycoprotein adhesin n=1 Tax=Limosilactobacillus sp. TaxID=2773925 RepID=UPI0025BDFE30|nr:serine-rich glycoprotein adhesin [Limosilactobacillus sp.]MCH3922972.1 serine-rich glycoprotein adhesin [Limosilactobacillus sp.]MCH3927655.1 serine-rich glycoprotein adhesin [Limosilactobacillus sp.]